MFVWITTEHLKQSIQQRVLAALCVFPRKHPDRGKNGILCLQQSFLEAME